MAMSKCKECGNQVSSKAKTCPQCGSKVKRMSLAKKILIVFGVLFVGFILWGFSGGSSSSSYSSGNTTGISKPEVLGIRRTYPIGSTINSKYIRTGPGMDSSNDNSGDISPHEKIYVLEKRGEWIRFRVTPKDEGWSAWMPKKHTISQDKIIAQREARFGKSPTQSSYDNSVRIVKDYIRKVAKDPDSLEFDEWSKVYYNENDGYVVYCVYRGKNSFGGYVTNANWFVIRHGSVVEIKEPDVYGF